MHRGSSKGRRSERRRPETLPLSASTAPTTILIEFELIRATSSETLHVAIARGATLRDAIRATGRSPEGCAVLHGDRPVPLDLVLREPGRWTLVPTFSGG